MKRIVVIVASLVCLNANAQNQEDIFRYSNQSITGSARTLGLSGAWGAAGADLSAASLNPAGLALYRRNEMMGSISITATNSRTDYNGGLMSDSRTMFNVPNIGMAFNITDQYMGKAKKDGIVGGTFAFGMNRLNDFQTNTQWAGVGKNTTVGNYLAKQANGYDSSSFWNSDQDNTLSALAWRVSLIDNNGARNKYASILDRMNDTNYTVRQYQQIQTRGRMNEWYAGGGLNVANFLYLGATLVIQHAQFSSENSYKETVLTSSVANNPYISSTIKQSLETSGTGVGGKFGIIFRPVDFIRFGASYHTPVRLGLTDYYQNSISMNYNGTVYNQASSPRKDTYKYQIITPQRFNASGSIVIGKLLILNADYELVDYTKGRLQSTDGATDFSTANQANSDFYKAAQNYKAGIEICGKYTRLRAGYAILGSPYNETYISKTNGMKQLISAGFGWVYDNQYFFDFAVSDRVGKDYITAYDGLPTSAVNITHKLNFVFGTGIRF
ncbi:MAG: hypothetical protein CFE21_15710 [Bacteroidetes bacterium B1(2017)]|nr:MAG: hypothetical protein CFE21_15710 [Bacteroidetes bacterium B1(2017)]